MSQSSALSPMISGVVRIQGTDSALIASFCPAQAASQTVLPKFTQVDLGRGADVARRAQSAGLGRSMTA